MAIQAAASGNEQRQLCGHDAPRKCLEAGEQLVLKMECEESGSRVFKADIGEFESSAVLIDDQVMTGSRVADDG